MTTIVILESVILSEKCKDFMVFLEENLPNVRSFPGCFQVSIFDNPNTQHFLIYEEWKSEAHHKAYIESITTSGVLSQLASFLEHPPTIKYFTKKDL